MEHVTQLHDEKPRIYVIHENEAWMAPLRDAFASFGVEFVDWNVGEGGEVDFSKRPPEGIFYNRMSASSHTRGHRFAIEHTHAILEWLEFHNRVLYNGSKALLLEGSKVRQYAALERYGITTPRTVAVTGNYEEDKKARSKLVQAAKKHFPNTRFISKHNRSGKGLGVRLWNEIQHFEKYLEDEFINEIPVDGIMLLQEYIQSPDNIITRCEFIDGKFLYAVQVSTSQGFELCPADNCSIIQNFKTRFEIKKDFNDPILIDFQKFAKGMNIGVCGIEFITDAAGKHYAYDVNTNTNYNASAEKRAFGGPLAMPTIAKLLIDRLASTYNEKIIVEEEHLVEQETKTKEAEPVERIPISPFKSWVDRSFDKFESFRQQFIPAEST